MSQPATLSLDSSPSDSSSSESPSPVDSLPSRYPDLHAATTDYRGGHRSFLDVIFDANLVYDGVRTAILHGLNTADFDNLRLTCRTIDHWLMMPSATGALRHPPDLVDKCHESGLPIPPSLPPQGSCPNPPQSSVRVRACQVCDYPDLRQLNPHQAITAHPREHLGCEICRRNWHDNIVPGQSALNQSRHDVWRFILATAHITLCRLCDREKKRQYRPEGHDGCVCYREYYKKRWLCQLCDVLNGHNIANISSYRRHLRQVGNTMQVMPVVQGPAGSRAWCPCGRQHSEKAPRMRMIVPTPWPGNHNIVDRVRNEVTHQWQQTTKQCVLCCGYIVPRVATARQPTRRSARLADRQSGRQSDRQHTMLGRSGKAATRHGVNNKGFEVRARGGW